MRKNPIPGGKIVGTARVAGIYVHETYLEYNGAKANVINFGRGVAPVLKLVSNQSYQPFSFGQPPHEILGEHSVQYRLSWNCSNQNRPTGYTRCSLT
jgi:hypothetical protein